jgi:hypothetical protein
MLDQDTRNKPGYRILAMERPANVSEGACYLAAEAGATMPVAEAGVATAVYSRVDFAREAGSFIPSGRADVSFADACGLINFLAPVGNAPWLRQSHLGLQPDLWHRRFNAGTAYRVELQPTQQRCRGPYDDRAAAAAPFRTGKDGLAKCPSYINALQAACGQDAMGLPTGEQVEIEIGQCEPRPFSGFRTTLATRFLWVCSVSG